MMWPWGKNRSVAVCVLLAAVCCASRTAGADGADTARALLERRFDSPYRLVRVPAELYRRFLEDLRTGGVVPAKPAPVAAAVAQTEYHLQIDDTHAQLGVDIELTVFDVLHAEVVPLLPAGVAWREITLNNKRVLLHERTGWLCLSLADLPAAASRSTVRVRLSARASLRAQATFDARKVSLAAMPSALTFLRVDAPEAWEISAARAPLRIVGATRAGTHGRMELAPGDRIEIAWQRLRPVPTRLGRPVYESWLSWHLTEGVQEVRAHLTVRIVGGERERLFLNLPRDAERVKVTGAAVREVVAATGGVTVHLKGRIRGAVQLEVEFTRPWPAGKGKAALGGVGIAGGRLEGGALVVTNAAGGIVLAEQVEGLGEIGLWAIPQPARALSSAAPVMAYAFTEGPWRLGVDVVSLAELPVRETLADDAEFTLLLRPDGSMMQKLELRVRNRARQFLRLRLPAPDCRLLFVHVSNQPVNVSRAADGALLIPLTKSLETLGGAVSFPVKLVFLHRTDALAARGRMSLPLPQLDIPIARAQCTLCVPWGFRADEWNGAFSLSEKLSVVVQRMEYGRGHLARDAKKTPELAEAERQKLLADNYYRSAMDAYKRGDYAQAEQAARNAQAMSEEFRFAGENTKLLSNLDLLQNRVKAKDRASVVTGKQIRQVEAGKQSQQALTQEKLLQQGWRAARAGKEQEAADAFKAAEHVGRKLGVTAAGREQQEAALKESSAWLETRNKPQAAPEGPAPNVEAGGQLAEQRASGRGGYQRRSLAFSEQTLTRKKERTAAVQRVQDDNVLAVNDLVTNTDEGRMLADLITRNYNGNIRYVDGNFAWKETAANAAVMDAIANLRKNDFQKVAFNTRALALTEGAIADMGVKWNTTERGRWAEVDEGRLNALLALERRMGVRGPSTGRGRGEIIPGTTTVLANGATLRLETARDTTNGLVVDGKTLNLAHERVLLISVNGDILALRAGATQFWTEPSKAAEIEEIPFETDVPAVGVPVRFEKVLVTPQEELRIECEYSYKEEIMSKRAGINLALAAVLVLAMAAFPVVAQPRELPAGSKGQVMLEWDAFQKIMAQAKAEGEPKITLPWPEVQNLLGVEVKGLQGPEIAVTWQQFKALLEWSVARQKPETRRAPSDYVIASADYSGVLRNEGAVFDLEMKISILRENQWTQIAILPATVALQSAELPEKCYLQVDGGKYKLITAAAGDITVKFRFAAAVTERAGAWELGFSTEPSGTSTLKLTVPGEKAEVTVAGAQAVLPIKLTAAETMVGASLPSGAPVKVSWERALEKVTQAPTRLYAVTHTLAAVGEAGITCREKIELSILHTGIRAANFIVPAGVSVLEVTGPAVHDWRVTNGKMEVRFNREVLGAMWLNLAYERTVSAAEAAMPVPVVRADEAIREKGHIAIVALANVEITAPKRIGATVLDVRELPVEILSMTSQPILLAFRYVGQEPQIQLAVKKHADVKVLLTIIDSAVVTSMQTIDGRRITKVIYNMRNNRSQFLRVSLPEGADVWTVTVAGKSTRPAMDEQGRVLVPLVRSTGASSEAASFPVEIIYVETQDIIGPKGSMRVDLPAAGVPVTHFMVQLYLPTEGDYSKWLLGDPHFEGPLHQLEHFSQVQSAPRMAKQNLAPEVQAQQLQVEFNRRIASDAAAAGVTPIQVNLPIRGRRFLFEKILVLGEPLYVDFKFSGWEQD